MHGGQEQSLWHGHCSHSKAAMFRFLFRWNSKMSCCGGLLRCMYSFQQYTKTTVAMHQGKDFMKLIWPGILSFLLYMVYKSFLDISAGAAFHPTVLDYSGHIQQEEADQFSWLQALLPGPLQFCKRLLQLQLLLRKLHGKTPQLACHLQL